MKDNVIPLHVESKKEQAVKRAYERLRKRHASEYLELFKEELRRLSPHDDNEGGGAA